MNLITISKLQTLGDPPKNESVSLFHATRTKTQTMSTQKVEDTQSLSAESKRRIEATGIRQLWKNQNTNEEPALTLYLSDSSSDDEDDYDEFEEDVSLTEVKSKARQGRRGTVMSAPVRVDNNFKPPVYLKRAMDHRSLQDALCGNFLFQVDEDEMDTLLDAFEPWESDAGTTIITQGDVHANYFYVIVRGSVDIFVDNKLVTSRARGNSFGELALLYDAPRAATVKVNERGSAGLWRLDRLTFKKILVNNHTLEVDQRVNYLSQVSLLSELSDLERKQVGESMTSRTYQIGEKIVKEGEIGGTFFVVASGEVKYSKGGEEISKRGTPGCYFGEIALLKNERRKCDVVATCITKVLCLDRKVFNYTIGKFYGKIKIHKAAFDKFDTDGSGQIDASEFKELMKELGEEKTEYQIAQMVTEVDENEDGEISFSEFQVLLSK